MYLEGTTSTANTPKYLLLYIQYSVVVRKGTTAGYNNQEPLGIGLVFVEGTKMPHQGIASIGASPANCPLQ